ncbi:MAG: hypothetical protein OXG24_05655 [Gammaproteobacteria bacterium]|nr:hypothetical protein [Gammaproteobacteria bacterium]
MNDKKKKQMDRAVKAMLNLGSMPDEKEPEFTKADLDRKFRMRVDRKGRGTMVEVKESD